MGRFKLVPVPASPEMVIAGLGALRQELKELMHPQHSLNPDDAAACFNAMTAVVPDAKPLGWALVKADGSLVSWHNTIHRDDPRIGGFSKHPKMADNASHEDAPHRWVQVYIQP